MRHYVFSEIGMKLNFRSRFSLMLASFALVLASCGSKNVPTSVSPTVTLPPTKSTLTAASSTTSPQPTNTESATATEEESPLFKAGRSYTDSTNDMEVSFLDVVGFQATVDEASETLHVVLHLRDIPPRAPLE